MKRKSIMLVVLLSCLCAGLRGQTTRFEVDGYTYEVLTDGDSSPANEVRLTGKGAYTSTSIPDAVTYEGREYKVVEFTGFNEVGVSSYSGQYGGTFSIGQNLRRISVPGGFYFAEINVDEKNPHFKSACGILYSYDGKILKSCPAGHATKDWTQRDRYRTIPDEVEVIDDYAFYRNQTWQHDLELPESLKKIGDYAFCRYAYIPNKIFFPLGLESIGDYAFDECLGLSYVSLPDGLKRIGKGAFRGAMLEEFVIPESVDSLMDLEIGNFFRLNSIVCLGTVPPKIRDKEDAVSQIENFNIGEVALVVPVGCAEAYRNDECWGHFKGITETDQCAAPTVTNLNGNIVCTSATAGAECITTVTSPDAGTYSTSEIPLQAVYYITTFARKEGYKDSNVTRATLYWGLKDMQSNWAEVNALRANAAPVIVSSTGNTLTVQGAEDGESVTAYDLDGRQLGSSVCRNGQATLRLNAKPESVILVKVGDDTIKVRMK